MRIFTYLILYSPLLPISIYGTMDVILLFEKFLVERRMKRRFPKEYSSVIDTNPLPNLGQIEHVFLDKTGTLTQGDFHIGAIYTNQQLYMFDRQDFNSGKVPKFINEEKKAIKSNEHEDTSYNNVELCFDEKDDNEAINKTSKYNYHLLVSQKNEENSNGVNDILKEEKKGKNQPELSALEQENLKKEIEKVNVAMIGKYDEFVDDISNNNPALDEFLKCINICHSTMYKLINIQFY